MEKPLTQKHEPNSNEFQDSLTWVQATHKESVISVWTGNDLCKRHRCFPLSCVFTNGSGLPVPLPDPDPQENIGYIGSKLYPSLLKQVVGFYLLQPLLYKYPEKSNENCLLPPSHNGWWLKPAQAATKLRSTEAREVSSLPEFYRLNSTNKAGWFVFCFFNVDSTRNGSTLMPNCSSLSDWLFLWSVILLHTMLPQQRVTSVVFNLKNHMTEGSNWCGPSGYSRAQERVDGWCQGMSTRRDS